VLDRGKLQSNSDGVKTQRRYTSALRKEQARETRLRVLAAARHLFLQHGYVATSMEAIAREANVATQTVYAAFGNKRTILARVLDLAIGGDDREVGVLEREEPQQMREEADQRQQLRMMAHGIRVILERAGPIFAVIGVAASADSEIAALHNRIQEERLNNMRRIVGWIETRGPLRAGLTGEEAADIMWTLTSADVHRMLTRDRGWIGDQYERWLGDALISSLLP
jgi:AcrR family transcriptional regulator